MVRLVEAKSLLSLSYRAVHRKRRLALAVELVRRGLQLELAQLVLALPVEPLWVWQLTQ